MIKADMTNREGYAKAFRLYANEKFNQLNSDNQDVLIPKAFWYEFVFTAGYLPNDWKFMPDRTDKERWSLLVTSASRIRTEMNHVSKLGAAGEPPFELKAHKGQDFYILRSLVSLAMVTYEEIGSMVETYLHNKRSQLRSTHDFLVEKAESGELPVSLSSHISMLDPMWNRAVKNAAVQITGYIEDVQSAKKLFDEFEETKNKLLSIEANS